MTIAEKESPGLARGASAPAIGLALLLKDVSVSRGGRRVIDSACLEARAGDAIVIRGPNGAGKTTLLRAIAGLLPVDSGAIEARDETGGGAEPRELTIYCGPLNAVKPALTVAENLSFWSALYETRRRRIDAAIAAFALEPFRDRQAGALSTGLARRLGLARLVIADRPIWLVDEPTISLDAGAVASFIALAEEKRAGGGIVILATHDAMSLAGARAVEMTLGDESR